MVRETAIDGRGRIVIPKHLREWLNLRRGSQVRLLSQNGKIIIMKSVTPNEFIRQMEGFIREGSDVQKAEPLKPTRYGKNSIALPQQRFPRKFPTRNKYVYLMGLRRPTATFLKVVS